MMSLKDDSEQEAMAVNAAVLVFQMFEKIARSHRRFNVNMARIGGLMKLVMSDKGQFKSTAFMHYEGVSADILRLIVVFLHATVEDLIRSQLPGNKTFSLQSGPNIDKALKQAGLDSSSLKPLYGPLTAMVKRRNRIVHGADFASRSSTVVEPWSVADVWQTLQWNLAVLAFYYQMLIVLTEPRQVFVDKYNKARKAMDENLEFARHLMKFPKEPLELQKMTLKDMSKSLESMMSLLGAPKES
jgi:hypothetical protein